MGKIGPAILTHFDSTTAITKVQNRYYNGKRRQIRRKYNTITEFLTSGAVRVDHIRIDENLADHLTKGLAREKVFKTSERMGLLLIERCITCEVKPTCRLKIPRNKFKV